MSTTEKQLKFLGTFCVHIAPRLDITPSDPDTPGLLREAAALHSLYLSQGGGAYHVRADELLQADKPRGKKIIGLVVELAFATRDLREAAKYALWLADELGSSSSKAYDTFIERTCESQ